MNHPKHVYEVGRWRIMVRFRRSRFGLHRIDGWSAFSWGLGFCTGNAVRRSRRDARVHIEKET